LFGGWIYTKARDIARLQRFLDPVGLVLNLILWKLLRFFPDYSDQFFVPFIVLVFLLSLILLPQWGIYYSFRLRSLWSLARRLTIGWLSVLSCLLLIGFLSKTSTLFSREFFVYWATSSWALLVVHHVLVRKWLRWQRVYGRNIRTAVFWGTAEQAKHLWAICENFPHLGIQPLIWFGDSSKAISSPTYGGNFKEFCLYLDERDPDLIYLGETEHTSELHQVIKALGNRTKPIYYLPHWSKPTMSFQMEMLGDQPAIALWSAPQTPLDGQLKRILDLTLSTLGILALSPLLTIIAVTIFFTSKGPIIFRQRRYGLDGKEFVVYKFRTMTVMEDGTTITQAQKGDDRITPVGRWLRRWSFDELPQLFNVIEGTMSLVGPRPHAVAHNEYYRKLIDDYMVRHMLKPGITGLAQIQGYRGETQNLQEMKDRIDADLCYLRDWTLKLDIKILILTILRWRSPKAY
jgi:putative colanic acid biosynthesis UDP-glucose lipid carrier transferase